MQIELQSGLLGCWFLLLICDPGASWLFSEEGRGGGAGNNWDPMDHSAQVREPIPKLGISQRRRARTQNNRTSLLCRKAGKQHVTIAGRG